MIKINEIVHRESGLLSRPCYGNGGLLASFAFNDDVYSLVIWRMRTPLDVTFLRHLELPISEDESIWAIWIEIDEEFIAVFEKHRHRNSLTIHFISATTLQIEVSLSTRNCIARYLSGFLVLNSKNDIR